LPRPARPRVRRRPAVAGGVGQRLPRRPPREPAPPHQRALPPAARQRLRPRGPVPGLGRSPPPPTRLGRARGLQRRRPWRPAGGPKRVEFVPTVGQGRVGRPVVSLVASVPVGLAQGPEYPVVTTLTTVTGQTDDATQRRLVPGTEHPWHQIGGRVLRQDGANP